MLSGGPSVAAAAGLNQSTRAECFPLRSSGMFAHACCVTTRLLLVLVARVLLCRSAFKHQETKTTPRSMAMQTIFHGYPGKRIGN